jgi:hypothetical protein
MGNDVTWGKDRQEPDHRNQNDPPEGEEIPGDTDAPDIVGRTGEEMPEVAHDNGPDHLDDAV